MNTMPTQKVVRLAKRPVGLPKPGIDLVVKEEDIPKVEQVQLGHVLVKNLFLSLDPAMRGWMRDAKSYIPPVQINAVMRGDSIAQVVYSNDSRLKKGDIVNTNLTMGWCEYSVLPASKLLKLPPLSSKIPSSAYLGVLGGTGLTAYHGLIDVGAPQPGETVVVSAAAGATGSVVAQIAKHVYGCHVVGIAGGPAKCKWLIDELGLDAAIDYKAGGEVEFRNNLKNCCPHGIDIFFDNVGGWQLDEVLRRINFKARIIMCGAISTYNSKAPLPGPSNINQILVNSARLEGFIVLNYKHKFASSRLKLAKWIDEGKIKFNEHVVNGLENAPDALLQLFEGSNKGKLVVKVNDPDQQSRL